MINIDLLIERIDALRVADNTRLDEGVESEPPNEIAAIMTAALHDGATVNIALSASALQQLVRALVDARKHPGMDRALGRH